MTIADDLFALSEHILLIAFVMIPVLISWLDLQLGYLWHALYIPKSSNLSIFIILFTLLHLATVGLCHSGHIIPILAYILGKIKAMTRNSYNPS